ncbi:hypothetical protein AL486_04155 [Pandoraea apista]|nr:hypothetical protein AL486_04155 [Pandoraea apista]
MNAEGLMHMMLIEGMDEPMMRSIRSRAALHGGTPEEEVLTILDNVARRPGIFPMPEWRYTTPFCIDPVRSGR